MLEDYLVDKKDGSSKSHMGLGIEKSYLRVNIPPPEDGEGEYIGPDVAAVGMADNEEVLDDGAIEVLARSKSDLEEGERL